MICRAGIVVLATAALAAAKFDRMILRPMETVANDTARPFFRRFATEP
jgi:hypothetical protein